MKRLPKLEQTEKNTKDLMFGPFPYIFYSKTIVKCELTEVAAKGMASTTRLRKAVIGCWG